MDTSQAGVPIINQPQAQADDDDRTLEEDVCSICLDSFDSQHNPPTITTCKHEFHLQCILEWSQRSKECPICWQMIVLKDPTSQELLSAVEDERHRRSVLKVRHVYEDPEVDHDVVSADSEFEEQVMRNFEAATRGTRSSRRRNNHRMLGSGPSQIHPSVSRAVATNGQEMYTSLEDFHRLGYASLRDNLASSSSVSTSIDQTSPSVGSLISNVTSQTPESTYCTVRPGVIDSQSPNGSPGRPITADMHAFSESVISKFSAASARYKESISKSTQGLKAKLLAKNSSVKELSNGVQREMSAGIARIFETLKRNNEGINSNFFKGKRTQDNSAETPRDVSLNAETMRL